MRYSENRLYRNDAGHFVDVAPSLGLADAEDTRAAAWGDFDGDGDVDLYVGYTVNAGIPNRLYRNDDQIFVNVATGLGMDLVGTTRQPSWVDYDGDGDMEPLRRHAGPAQPDVPERRAGGRWCGRRLRGWRRCCRKPSRWRCSGLDSRLVLHRRNRRIGPGRPPPHRRRGVVRLRPGRGPGRPRLQPERRRGRLLPQRGRRDLRRCRPRARHESPGPGRGVRQRGPGGDRPRQRRRSGPLHRHVRPGTSCGATTATAPSPTSPIRPPWARTTTRPRPRGPTPTTTACPT